MSMRDLEGIIKNEAAMILNNHKLRIKDMQEWSSGEIAPHEGEVVIKLQSMSIWVAVKKEMDKRKIEEEKKV